MSRLCYTLTSLLIVAALLAGCGSNTATATFTNPVYAHDFPDPFVLHVGTMYYAYSTDTGSVNIPEIRSKDLVHWKAAGDAMPVTSFWLDSNIWAPSVARMKNGTYVLYYAAHDQALNLQCLGVARGTSPAGPFRDRSRKPFLCQTGEGGDIDPAVFQDDNGKQYLYFKNDGNCCGQTTYIWVQQLSGDGTKLLGKPVQLVYNDQSWEGNVIEGPTMWKHAGKYFLFYSGGPWDSPGYAVGYATCKTALGPCTENLKNPILEYHQGCRAQGPGGETIVTDSSGQTWMAYHAWVGDETDYTSGGMRALWIGRLSWKNGKPSMGGPDCKKQLVPAS